MTTVFLLLIAFQLKHFICDYPLQNTYMLGKMGATNWVKPLAAHAAVHAIGTMLIVLWISPILAIALAFIDFIIHFTVDRIKASPFMLGRFKPDQPYFWWSLGADQMAHHLTHYLFIYIIISIL